MRILFCGDVVGRSGREALARHLPGLKETLRIDFTVVNGENAAGGYGPTPETCKEVLAAGADVITSGNHIWDQSAIVPYIAREERLLRPHNFPARVPGAGARTFEAGGRRVLVLNLMGRLFMDPLDDPFAVAGAVLDEHRLGAGVDAVVIDLHGEATSEKAAFAHAVDGRASLVVGTHTHVPTADARILPGGTAFQSDAGMCGNYQSVIGYEREPWVEKFRRKMPVRRIPAAGGEGTLAGVFVETEDATGRAVRVEPVVTGGVLAERIPGG